jgi:murein DD-endopeptidase MepM/ murein hydrolase activator NlpD
MRSRLLWFVAPVVAFCSVLLPGGWAVAQVSTTTTTEAVPTTTSTTAATEPTTTTAPPPITSTTTPGATVTAAPGAGTADEPLDDPSVLTPEMLARMNSVRRTAANNNTELLEAIRLYAAAAGLPLEQAMVQGLGHFPVAGPAHWVHDWLHARRGPPVHLHQGTDIWAAQGTPIRAPDAGRLRYEDAGLGGLAAYITTADGTYYYLAHMAATAPGLTTGTNVAQGQIVGFVGDSGNARGGPAHCHFEIHPRGGAAIDPKPILDRWTKEATAYALALASSPKTPPLLAPSLVVLERRDGGLAQPMAAPPRPLRTADAEQGLTGSLLVVGSLLALSGGRVVRRVRRRRADGGPATEGGQRGPETGP